MALFGFIVSFLMLGFFSVSLVVAAYANQAISGCTTKYEAGIIIVWAIVLSALWYLLFTHSPLTITTT